MTYVITQGCCNDSSCIAVCPVQCIRPRPGDPDFSNTEQLYIDPETCIDCGACLDVCPVEAIHAEWDIPAGLDDLLGINADYFVTNPLVGVGPPTFTRRVLPERRPALSVAIVGSGPAACYAAEALSDIAGVQATLFERLPTPFGLVRAGVAPDHLNTKKMAEHFGSIISRKNVECFFNVEVGVDISLAELLEHHHAVLWAGGARGERRLGIPGEDLVGCGSAKSFVAWYNGHPDHADDVFDLSGARVVVIGNGNVALDVARTLLRPAEVFRTTEMADHAVAALARSNVNEVVVAARRGPEFAAYSLGELTALERSTELTVLAEATEIPHHTSGDRRHDIIVHASERNSDLVSGPVVHFRFALEPVSINGVGRVESVTFRQADGSLETVTASLVLRAIGYRGTPVDGLPFDTMSATLPNNAGKVIDRDNGFHIAGIYCAGWIKRGPRGIIGTNKQDAEETVDSLLHDFAGDRLPDPQYSLGELTPRLLDRVPDLVDKQGWMRIDAEEKRRGRVESRPRKKLVTVAELIAASRPSS